MLLIRFFKASDRKDLAGIIIGLISLDTRQIPEFHKKERINKRCRCMLTLHNFSTHVFDTGIKGINIGYFNEGLSSKFRYGKTGV
jgi:hypothetical protein